MRPSVLRTLGALAVLAASAAAQDVFPLYPGVPPGSTDESYPEKQYFSKVWNTEVVTNVTRPTLTVFKPAAGTAGGSAIVICPGGGYMALSINSEGIDVAKWLAARGMTAFVLKYRLAHTGEDATQEFATLYRDRPKFGQLIGKVVPLAIADGIAAVAYVRKHASQWGISPDRVGIVGFSAGGGVTAGVAFRYTERGPEGLVKGKKAYLVLARGGNYSLPPMQAFNFQDPYLRAALGLIGITDIEVIAVEGVAHGPAAAEHALSAALGQVAAVAA